MKTCDRCGAQLEDNAKFCTDCGAKQEPKKSFCSNCGTELNPNAKFCSECGTPASSAQTDRSEDKNRESATELNGIAQEIQEQGGIIVYDDQDEAEVEAAKKLLADLDPDMGYYLSDDFDMHKLVDNCVKAANLKFKKFGEPGRDIQEYGYPDDDYHGKIEYAILDDEKLILRGEGNTFRVLSDEAQKESEENFWVLNKAIRKVKDQIDTILVEGDGMSLRARLFKDFSRLETVILGNGVSGIRLEAFAGCPIKNVVLPSTMWHLVTSAFVGAKFKSFFIPPLSPKEQYFTQFQSDSIVDCKNLKYVFLPQRLFKARKVSNFFKGCDNLDADNVWEVKDIMSENNNLKTNQKDKTMENLKVPGYSVLILSGKGYVLEVEGDINLVKYGILTKDYKITLNGKDVTKEIEVENNNYAFMNKCFEIQQYDLQMHLSEELQLPPSIYLIPEDTNVNDIKLMSVGYAFPDEKNNLIVADFIFHEDEELESDSFRNEEGLLKPFTSDEETYPDNAEWYNEHYGDEESFTLKWEGDEDDEDDYDEDYDDED